jgi:hypothetical protein
MQGLQSENQNPGELAKAKKEYRTDPDGVFLRIVKPLMHGRTADEVIARANGEDAR